jgi:hypothetical protein
VETTRSRRTWLAVDFVLQPLQHPAWLTAVQMGPSAGTMPQGGGRLRLSLPQCPPALLCYCLSIVALPTALVRVAAAL